jgi:hypothetical protein
MSEPIRSISRRRFGLAISLPWLSGCGFGPLDPVRSIDARAGRIRIVTPWGDGLRDRFEKSFAAWLVENAIGPVSIRWLTVTDSEMATISLAQVLSSADVILGGHRLDHERSKLTGINQSGLNAFRFPVIRTIRPTGQLPPVSKDLNSNEPKSPLQVFDQRAASSPFEFSGDSNDPLVRAYFLAIFEDAPDQAAGYARWIRTAGSSVEGDARKSGLYRVLKLSENREPDRALESLWTGGPGTLLTLGIDESDPIHWPESMSWNSERNTNRDLVVRFCENQGWFTRRSSPGNTASQSTVIRELMARIVRRDCRTELMHAWSEIQAATGTRRQETESYLTTPPPWPPASIQALRQERGFQFVVALADQMAIDRAQRDWLVEEFGKPGGPIDFRMLETADNGRLVHSTRSMAWLHAEWTAWLKQRCRRSVRFLRTSNASHGQNPDFRRSGATIFT